jgi:hypothetical protein
MPVKNDLNRLLGLDRIAGPDDPIYQGGVVMTSFRRSQTPMLSTYDQKVIVERMRSNPKYKQP